LVQVGNKKSYGGLNFEAIIKRRRLWRKDIEEEEADKAGRGAGEDVGISGRRGISICLNSRKSFLLQ
jgi:hypothetical protein